MAKHEFGIMTDDPRPGKRYDKYEPWKYACISVDDNCLKGVGERLNSMDSYWHTLSVKGKGLAYCGITLLPPCSLKIFIDTISDNSELCELRKLLEKALDQNKWIIHYGLRLKGNFRFAAEHRRRKNPSFLEIWELHLV